MDIHSEVRVVIGIRVGKGLGSLGSRAQKHLGGARRSKTASLELKPQTLNPKTSKAKP